jgi:hypothetical protein
MTLRIYEYLMTAPRWVMVVLAVLIVAVFVMAAQHRLARADECEQRGGTPVFVGKTMRCEVPHG